MNYNTWSFWLLSSSSSCCTGGCLISGRTFSPGGQLCLLRLLGLPLLTLVLIATVIDYVGGLGVAGILLPPAVARARGSDHRGHGAPLHGHSIFGGPRGGMASIPRA